MAQLQLPLVNAIVAAKSCSVTRPLDVVANRKWRRSSRRRNGSRTWSTRSKVPSKLSQKLITSPRIAAKPPSPTIRNCIGADSSSKAPLPASAARRRRRSCPGESIDKPAKPTRGSLPCARPRGRSLGMSARAAAASAASSAAILAFSADLASLNASLRFS